MRVPETVPAHNGQAKLSASRLQHSTEEIFRIERRVVAAGKDKSLGVRTYRHSALCQEGLAHRLAHWHISATALRLWASELSLIDGLAHVNGVMNEIDVFP